MIQIFNKQMELLEISKIKMNCFFRMKDLTKLS